MKRFLVITALIMFPLVSHAQYYGDYYNTGYYNTGNYNGSYNTGNYGSTSQPSANYNNSATSQSATTNNYFPGTNYYAPHKIQPKKQREIGQISVGADYVLGYSSYKTVDFVVDAALTDGQNYVSDTKDLDRSFSSLSLNIGWRPLRYIGIEAFYQTSLDDNKVTYTESYSHYPEFARGEYTTSYKVYGLDLLGYVPINDYIDFIASIGVGKYDAEAKVKVTAYEDTSYNNLRSSSKTFSDSKWAWRVGGGAEIWLSKHLTFRIMGRWTKIDGDFMKYITEINFGVRYHF